MSEQVPQKNIGRYLLQEFLGRGSTGSVYKAYDDQEKRHVAVKIITADKSERTEHRQRFLRGAQLAIRLKHRHIIPIYDFGEDKNRLFIVTELLEGRDLKQVILQGGSEPLNQKILWMTQLCDALEFAHRAGVIHRDIKPANIYIRTSGELVLMDFEIARGKSSDITQAGVIIGTPEYFSPEQILMVRLDARSDLFSAGLVFYELLTGVHPFRTAAFPSTLHKILNESPVPPMELNREIPQSLNQIVLKSLEKDLNARYASARVLKEALSNW